MAERALRIGLLAICNANATLNVDVVKAEFGRLVTDMAQPSRRRPPRPSRQRCARTSPMVTVACHASSRPTWAIPASCNRLVGDLFDERRRDSALGKLSELLGRYFDGDGSQLATLLDPTRQGSPLHQFRAEMTDEFRRLNERLEALEDAPSGTGRGARTFGGQGSATSRTCSRIRPRRRWPTASGDLLERTGAEAR